MDLDADIDLDLERSPGGRLPRVLTWPYAFSSALVILAIVHFGFYLLGDLGIGIGHIALVGVYAGAILAHAVLSLALTLALARPVRRRAPASAAWRRTIAALGGAFAVYGIALSTQILWRLHWRLPIRDDGAMAILIAYGLASLLDLSLVSANLAALQRRRSG